MNLSKKIDFFGSNFWLSWFFILLLIFFIHCLTLTISPIIWQDEVQIIEYGRTFLEPNSDWSYNWDIFNLKPVLIISYLGCLLQELAFRASGFSILGPRLFNLIGGLFASSMLVGWLLSRGTSYKVSAILGITFLLDPWIARTYRVDRVDCWAIGLCLLVCWLLSLNDKEKYLFASISGGISAVSFFVWPSVLMIYPLFFYQILVNHKIFLKKENSVTLNSSFLKIAILFCITGLIATGLLVIPLLPSLPQILENFGNTIKLQRAMITSSAHLNLNILHFVRLDPFLPLLALVSLFCHRNKILIACTCFALTISLITGFYSVRAIYLYPYIFLLASFPFQKVNISKFFTNLTNFLLIASLVWASSISLIGAPFTAISNQYERETSVLIKIGESAIGRGDYSVLDYTWGFYPAGRSLGWKVYNSFYTPDAFPIESNAFLDFFSTIDFVIISASSIELPKLLATSGFQLVSNEVFLKKTEPQINDLNFWEPRILTFKRFLNYDLPSYYGNYSIYRR